MQPIRILFILYLAICLIILFNSLAGYWEPCAWHTQMMSPVGLSQAFPVSRTPVLYILPKLQASWNLAAETPVFFSPVLWKTQSGETENGREKKKTIQPRSLSVGNFIGHCPCRILTSGLL